MNDRTTFDKLKAWAAALFTIGILVLYMVWLFHDVTYVSFVGIAFVFVGILPVVVYYVWRVFDPDTPLLDLLARSYWGTSYAVLTLLLLTAFGSIASYKMLYVDKPLTYKDMAEVKLAVSDTLEVTRSLKRSKVTKASEHKFVVEQSTYPQFKFMRTWYAKGNDEMGDIAYHVLPGDTLTVTIWDRDAAVKLWGTQQPDFFDKYFGQYDQIKLFGIEANGKTYYKATDDQLKLYGQAEPYWAHLVVVLFVFGPLLMIVLLLIFRVRYIANNPWMPEERFPQNERQNDPL